MHKLIIVLTMICIVAAIALAVVYDLTKEPIAEQQRKRLASSLKMVLPEIDNEKEVDKDTKEVITGKDKNGEDVKITFYQGKMNGNIVGRAFKVIAPDGYGGNIEIIMGVNPKKEITGVEILSHRETPGLGDGIKKKEWKDTLKGRSLANSKLGVKKDGGDIDQFTGATISPRAVVKAIKAGLLLYEKEFENAGG